MSGAAAASGLNAMAAAHNPALATISMLNRSGFHQRQLPYRAPAEPHSRTDVVSDDRLN